MKIGGEIIIILLFFCYYFFLIKYPQIIILNNYKLVIVLFLDLTLNYSNFHVSIKMKSNKSTKF